MTYGTQIVDENQGVRREGVSQPPRSSHVAKGSRPASPFRIATVPIPAHRRDARVRLQPGRQWVRRTLPQQIDHTPTFQIHQAGSEALSLAPGPLINANHTHLRRESEEEPI